MVAGLIRFFEKAYECVRHGNGQDAGMKNVIGLREGVRAMLSHIDSEALQAWCKNASLSSYSVPRKH
jgi:hypothetical protein